MAALSSAVSGRIQGFREAKAAFQALPVAMRERMSEATQTTVQEIARQAKAQVETSPSVQTRSLLNAIGWSLNPKNGRGKAGIANVTTRVNLGGQSFRIKGRLIMGAGGSAARSAGARLMRPTRYAHFVEFGTIHMPAEPFMMPAAKKEQQPYLRRCQDAGKAVERDLSAIGASFL